MKELLKRHKTTMFVTSLLTLLPLLVGLILWNKLPEQMPTHFGPSGEPDGYSPKAFAVFGLPLSLLAVQWVCLLATGADPKRENINGKILGLVLWIVPVICIIGEGCMYAYALGYTVNIAQFMFPLIALAFIVIGNYLPKCRQSYTMGIKLPWTLADEDNWNKTHRMAGPIWMVCGLVLLVCTFLPSEIGAMLVLPAILIVCLVPTIYSYRLAKKKGKF